jgi:hypothetical protein
MEYMYTVIFEKMLEVIFGFEFFEDGGVDEGDGDGGVRVLGVIVDFGDIVIVGSEGFEDIVVIIEIEGDGVGQCFSP